MNTTAIGFANKFYTLWNVSESVKDNGYGHKLVTTNFSFVKNISFDKDTALAKYPEAQFDENLRGRTKSWKSFSEVWDSVDVFRFGKYKYSKIDDISDSSYIAWYWDHVYDEHKDYVESILVKRGYEVRSFKTKAGRISVTTKYIVSPEDLIKEREYREKVDTYYNKCLNGEPLEVVPTTTLNDEGYYRSDDDIVYKFNNFKVMDYRGFTYGLPIDLGGHTKRIKNKKVYIMDYSYSLSDNYILTITVKNFKIIK